MFHHVFISGLSDIGNSIDSLGAYSVEFEERGQFCFLSVRFWKGDVLCRVMLSRFGRTIPHPTGYFGTLSRLMSGISVQPDLVCVSGCLSEVVQSFEKSGLFKKGVQYPFRFDEFNLPRIMHRQNFSVFGRVDFFSVLDHLISSLRGALYHSWTLETPELVKVSSAIIFRRFLFRRSYLGHLSFRLLHVKVLRSGHYPSFAKKSSIIGSMCPIT